MPSSQRPNDHWRWCRQKRLRRSKCPCNDISDDMPFIRVDWLLENDLRNLPRMQELPKEAFLFPSEMDYGYFISHRWLHPKHPDVTGRQLVVALPAIWSDSAHHHRSRNNQSRKQTGVWYDYLCLPQRPRTRSEEDLFRVLLKQHSGLTLITVPILVVDRDVDYASRAWCVAEVLGTHRSGFSGKSVSLAMHLMKHSDIFSNNVSVWDSRIEVDDGFLPGLHKLHLWLNENNISTETSGDEIKQGWQKHKDYMLAANQVYYDFCIAKLKGYKFTDEGLLWAIAQRNRLQCTEENDLLTCMHIMTHVLNAFEE